MSPVSVSISLPVCNIYSNYKGTSLSLCLPAFSPFLQLTFTSLHRVCPVNPLCGALASPSLLFLHHTLTDPELQL